MNTQDAQPVKSASRILSFEEFTEQQSGKDTEMGGGETEETPDQNLLPEPVSGEQPVDGTEPNLSINQMDAIQGEEPDVTIDDQEDQDDTEVHDK